MNCQKITKGMVVHNYREMCKLLDEEVKTGNAKMYQLKNWSRYFQFEKNKHQFTITEIYDTPMDLSDGRAGRVISRRNGESLDLIEPLLMELICSPENRGDVVKTKSEIYSYLGMVNSEYSKHNSIFDCPEFVYFKGKKVIKEQLIYFYEVSNSVVYTALRSALNSLAKRGIIEFDNWCEIRYKDGSRFVAGTEEMDRITEIEQETLDDMGITKKGQALTLGNRQIYFRKRNSAAKNIRDWEKIFNVLRISLLCDLENNSRVKTIASCDKSFEELRLELNEVIFSRILSEIQKDKENFSWTGKVQYKTKSDQSDVPDSPRKQNGSDVTYKKGIKNEVFRRAMTDKAFLETQMLLIGTLIKI